MRARVVERSTGNVAGEIEAATSYDLWLALLDWGERQGLPRFTVPARYRTDRVDDHQPSTTPLTRRAKIARPAPAVAPEPATIVPTTTDEPVASPTQLRLEADNLDGGKYQPDKAPACAPQAVRRRRSPRVIAAVQLRFDL